MNDELAEGRLIGVDLVGVQSDGGSSIETLGGFTGSESAAMNMALDQAILESVDRTGVPCLRFYQWQEPTLSLGYFQKLEDRQTHQESGRLACVRRASGGGAIVHHHELTYSIAIPDDHSALVSARLPKQSDQPKIKTSIGANAQLYTLVHKAIAIAISEFGIAATPYRLLQSSEMKKKIPPAAEPVLCFQRRTSEDLIVAGYKVLGSAQRRGKRSLLQHGSLLIRSSSYSPQLPGLINLGAKMASKEELIAPIAQRLQEALKTRWSPSSVQAFERRRGTEIASARFLNFDWTHRR